MKRNRILFQVIAFTLSLSLMAGVVFAEDWFLDDGNITIDVTGDKQQISQNLRTE